MTDFAELILKADTRQLVQGEQALDELTEAGRRAELQTDKLNTSTARAGTTVRAARTDWRNIGLQLNQVSQQTAATGNFMQALSIQMPDLLLGFGGIGIAAGIAAPAVMGFASSLIFGADSADDFSNAMDEIEGAIDRLDQPLETLKMTMDDLREKYGDAAVRVREFALAQAEIRLEQARGAMMDQVGILGDMISEYEAFAMVLPNSGREVIRFGGDLRRLVRDFELTEAQGLVLAGAFDELRVAQTGAAQTDALRGILNILEEMEIPLGQMPEDLQIAIDNMITLDAATASAETAMNNLAAAAARVAQAQAETSIGLDAFGGAGPDVSTSRLPSSGRTSRRRSGGGSSPSDDRMREAARIFDRTRTAAEKYAAELEDLNELREMGYLSEETHARAVAQLGEELTGATRRADNLRNATSQTFADIVTGAQSAGDAISSLLANFAGMLANAAFGSLFKSVGLFDAFGGLLSFDGGGYTGAGARSGGVDGKGGFPAILHPNETVVDHTRGGGGGGGSVHVTVSVGRDGSLMPVIEQVSGNVAANVARNAIRQYDRSVLPQSVRRVQADPRRIG